MGSNRQALSLVGSATCDEALYQLAYQTGCLIAQSGTILVCGGGGGVMAAGCAGVCPDEPPNRITQKVWLTMFGRYGEFDRSDDQHVAKWI